MQCNYIKSFQFHNDVPITQISIKLQTIFDSPQLNQINSNLREVPPTHVPAEFQRITAEPPLEDEWIRLPSVLILRIFEGGG